MVEYTTYTDPEIIAGLKRSDPEALKVLFYRYSEALHRFCYHLSGSSDTIDDVIQESFIRVWEHRGELDAEKSIKSFVFQIANNLMIDSIRKTNVRRSYAERQIKEFDGDQAIQNFETSELVESLLKNLHPIAKAVFLLARIEGFDRTEIAEMLNISEKTVSNRLWEALKVLKKEIKKP